MKRALVLALVLLMLTACGHGAMIRGDVQPLAPMAVMQVPVQATAVPSAGAIYREGPGLRLYTDRKAREVGDIVTINLSERTQASTRANTAITKESTNTMSGTVFGAPVTVGGQDVLDNSLSNTRDFAGDGNSTQSNQITGTLTAQVVQKLPNGNLVIQGSKELTLNQGNELIQVQGIIRTADIGPDNTIASTRVADARIVYGGRGPIARSNAMGWLDRFFNGAWFPN
ncbi:flagellar basal body L-ring protein FlgH [Silanimonas sp.]|jgi:flagellar L-ring protein precursor FlgH|uniref:flagellar basal body L-ring protein FlgH n=1 Tax=Silanimonas sp. TaxID=1929290 RepID=UPI0022C6D368|nr:flagellar basal body L-ring protein FlgH [Silanimonas sp.]MCZ8062143.1 flagellar basal body L-ring protein FlgH [Silanimonas sp.]